MADGGIVLVDQPEREIEDRPVTLTEGGLVSGHVDAPVPRDVVDDVPAAERLEGTAAARRIVVVRRVGVERSHCGSVPALAHRSD